MAKGKGGAADGKRQKAKGKRQKAKGKGRRLLTIKQSYYSFIII